MAKEIEYKFLVDDLHAVAQLEPASWENIMQGYFTTKAEGVMARIRISHWSDGRKEAWITVKGPSSGMSRDEFEYQVPMEDGLKMVEMCGDRHIIKTRYCFPHGDHTVELDVFSGKHEGLVMAEIEVKSEDEQIPNLPLYLGKDVSKDYRYTNASLALGKDDISDLIYG